MVAERPRAIAFSVPGEPRGKGRARSTKSGRHYSDAKTVAYESMIALAAREALGGFPPLDGPLDMDVAVRMAPAPSASAKRRALMIDGQVYPTKKPDLDNVAKAVCDGCNGVAYRDDVQIVRLTIGKAYAKTPGVMVRVKPTPVRVGDA